MSRDTDSFETVPALSVKEGDCIVVSCDEGFNRIAEVRVNETYHELGGHRWIEVLGGDILLLPIGYPVQRLES